MQLKCRSQVKPVHPAEWAVLIASRKTLREQGVTCHGALPSSRVLIDDPKPRSLSLVLRDCLPPRLKTSPASCQLIQGADKNKTLDMGSPNPVKGPIRTYPPPGSSHGLYIEIIGRFVINLSSVVRLSAAAFSFARTHFAATSTAPLSRT